MKLTRSGITLNKWIASEITGANAHRSVTNSPTFRIPAARSRTRITAFLINASLLTGAFAVTDTLWSTSRRSAHKLGQTGARWDIIEDSTYRVRAAR